MLTKKPPPARQTTAILATHYQPPGKRKIPTVYSWDELTTLAAKNKPPSVIILESEGKKIEIKINKPKRGQRWTFSICATS